MTIASAILPGTGQALMRQKRSALYFALEGAGLAYYFSRHNRGVSERSLYRKISRDVARAVCLAAAATPRFFGLALTRDQQLLIVAGE